MSASRGADRARHCAALLLSLLAGAACATPRIALVTMQPGEAYWSRFGHNAILVQEEDGRATHYNYGFFDFDEPGFLARFLQGHMEYRLAALPAELDLATYADEGRGVSRQWLALDDAAATELAAFLAWNARPENARYRYDYFTANCSTKVRDALDRALGGWLEHQLSGRSRGLTHRWESLRLGAPVPWLFLGMHAGLGPAADRALSRWGESFVPMRLAEALDEATLPDGRPLVLSEEQLLPHRVGLPPDERPWVFPWFLATGLLLGGIAWLGLAAPARWSVAALHKPAVVLAGLAWMLAGCGGLLLAALWAFTDHQAAWGNENLLLFNPLALLLMAALPALWRRRPVAPWLRAVAMVVLVCALLAVFLKFLPWRIQDNKDWIALWLPLHAALLSSLPRAPNQQP